MVSQEVLFGPYWTTLMETEVSQLLLKKEERLQSLLAGITPNAEVRLKLSRRLEDLRLMTLASWHMPVALGTMVRLTISEINDATHQDPRLQAMLASQSHSQRLYSQICHHPREFFGTSVKRLKWLLSLKFEVFIKRQRKAREVLRRRGYPTSKAQVSHSEKEWLNDFRSTELQLAIEAERDFIMRYQELMVRTYLQDLAG